MNRNDTFRMLAILAKILRWIFPTREVKNKRTKKVFQRIWYNVWLEEEFASPEERIIEKYEKYDRQSTDLIVYFFGLIPIGTMRIIWPGYKVLPALKDFNAQILGNPLAEFTLFTVKKRWRGLGHLFSLILMREGYQRATNANMDGIVIITEKPLFILLSKIVKLPFKKIGEAKFYEGGLCFPAYMSISEAERTLPKRSPELNKFFTSF